MIPRGILLAVLTALAPRARAATGFTVCFEPPKLSAPDAAVRGRVESYAALLRELLTAGRWNNAAWVEAIITHESGADARAVSPTGCAGLAAICSGRKDGPHCCVKDAADGYRTIYDLCNSEASSGYRCDPKTDERFDPRFALNRTIAALRGVDKRVRRLAAQGSELAPTLAVPMAYNAGWRAFPEFPKRSSSVENIMGQLDLSRGPYRSWDDLSKANKAVEIYDYLLWFPFLAGFYGTGPKQAPAPPPALLCYSDVPDAGSRFRSYPADSPAAARIRASFGSVTVKRLSFGKYADSPALFAPAAGKH